MIIHVSAALVGIVWTCYGKMQLLSLIDVPIKKRKTCQLRELIPNNVNKIPTWLVNLPPLEIAGLMMIRADENHWFPLIRCLIKPNKKGHVTQQDIIPWISPPGCNHGK